MSGCTVAGTIREIQEKRAAQGLDPVDPATQTPIEAAKTAAEKALRGDPDGSVKPVKVSAALSALNIVSDDDPRLQNDSKQQEDNGTKLAIEQSIQAQSQQARIYAANQF